MNQLDWNSSLESTAERLVSCSRNSFNEDDTFSLPMYSYGKYRSLNIQKILRFWTRERRYYVPEDGDCIPWDSCNRYRNMAGADRLTIGCALKECPRRTLVSYALLCMYGGGDRDSFRHKPGSVCTQCKDSRPFCDEGLCACTKTCQKENVGAGRLNASTCTCECTYGLGPNCDQECRNPEIYADYDLCETVTQEECNGPDVDLSELMRESCPEECVCRKHPNQE